VTDDNDEKRFSSGQKMPHGSLTKILLFTVEFMPLCYTKVNVKQSLHSPWKPTVLKSGSLWLPDFKTVGTLR